MNGTTSLKSFWRVMSYMDHISNTYQDGWSIEVRAIKQVFLKCPETNLNDECCAYLSTSIIFK